MHVYYIGNMFDGCYQVRCLLPQIHNGWNGSKLNLTDPVKPNHQLFEEAMLAKVIVFQRPSEKEKVEAAKLLQKAGKKIVFDNDDTYIPNSGVPTTMTGIFKDGEGRLKEMNKNIISFLKTADLVTTTTEFLAKEYRQYNDNVVVLPNMVDPFDYPEPLRNRKKKIRVGLTGSAASNDDYKGIVDLLDYLKEREDVEIVLFGLPPKEEGYEKMRKIYAKEFKFWEKYADERQPFVHMGDYYRTLNNLKLDLMLIPRHESYFNKCKSNIKYLEASMLEIPVVAQGFTNGDSPYDKDIDGHNGRIVKTGESWIPEVKRLLDDKQLRRGIGMIAREYVLSKYNIEDNYKLWADAYSKL